ncbi:MAG: hypothetical protein R6U11_00860 [Bacteroidales bacterium]
MKTMKINFAVAFIATIFITSCSMLNKPTSGDLARKGEDKAKEESTEGTVEVIESEMEKTEGYDFSDKKGIIISGKAKYIPAKVNAKPFEDFDGEFRFILLDGNGNKLRTFYVSTIGAEMGKNGEPENVEPNEPFSFKLEKNDIDPEDWEKVEGHEFKEWY